MPAFMTATEVDPDTLRSAAEIVFTELRSLEDLPEYHERISKLHHQLESIIKVCHHLREDDYIERRGERSWTSGTNLKDRQSLQELRRSVKLIIGRCYHNTARPLQDQLRRITPPHALTRGYDVPYLSPDILAWYDDITVTLQIQAQTLELLLDATAYVFARKQPNPAGEQNASTLKTAGRLQILIENLNGRLENNVGEGGRCPAEDIEVVRQALETVDSMGRPWPSVSINQHFRIRSGTNKYTGRVRELQGIRDAFGASVEATQRRFVIQGPPGLGKSELALKFAYDERASYWGVFWVDASSKENATESFKRIAEIEGTASNQLSAAKNWLSTRADVFEWLLIIDNADVDEDWIEDLFPSGHRGCLLLTTRNPAHLRHGTVGQLRLKGMEHDEANALLLRSAQIAQPWTTIVVDHARSVCEFLSYLPIALVHAGQAIVQELCDLAGYIDFVDKTIHRVREYWVWVQKHNNHDPELLKAALAEDEAAKYIFGTYEVLYESLEGATMGRKNVANPLKVEHCKDALQLLQAFSYMHFQNIRLDMLVCAAVNPFREAEEGLVLQKKEEEMAKRLGIRVQRSWKESVQTIVRNLLSRVDLPPVLPDALKNADDLDAQRLENVVLIRVRSALKELETRGLVARSDTSDGQSNMLHRARYHMHPMVHRWVRERPRPTAAEDGLFCQIAKTVLARAVRLQGQDGKHEQAMRRELKPHVDHVRNCETVIQRRILENQIRKRSIWSSIKLFQWMVSSKFDKMKAVENARFSKVYMESGEFAEAEDLLRKVHDFTASRAGHDHDMTHRVQLALSTSLSHQTRHNEAEDMIRKVYESRKRTLGLEHPRTLEITRELGQSVLGQGRLTESLQLCQTALDGLSGVYGDSHRETLMCINQIGKVHFFKLNLEESLSHHELAFRRAEKLSPEDALPETDFLILKEEFAIASTRLKKDVEQAEAMLRDVIERRSKLLGEAQPYTLQAKANLGRTLAALRRFDEAVEVMSKALEIAQRSLGEEHLGVLAGKTWFGQVLMEKGELDRAESNFRQATNKELYRVASGRDGEYQDRIMAVWLLAECMEKQGKPAEALKLCRELETTIPLVGGHGLGSQHKLLPEVSRKAFLLEELIRTGEQKASEDQDDCSQDTVEFEDEAVVSLIAAD